MKKCGDVTTTFPLVPQSNKPKKTKTSEGSKGAWYFEEPKPLSNLWPCQGSLSDGSAPIVHHHSDSHPPLL